MNTFTIEVVTKPVVDGAWGPLRDVTDHLPGTILLEDAEEPMLVIPVEAMTLRSAALFVQGAMNVLGHEIVWGRAYLAGELVRVEPAKPGTDTDLQPGWLEDEATTKHARDAVLV